MKQRKWFLITVVAVTGLLVTSTFSIGAGLGLPSIGGPLQESPAQADSLQPDSTQYVEGEVLVQYHSGSVAADKRNFRAAYQLSLKEELPSSYIEVLQTPKGLSVAETVAMLKKDPRAALVQPNFKYYPTSNDPYYNLLWGLENKGQSINGVYGTSDKDIDGSEAWTLSTDAAVRVIVAVIDTGMDIAHPDLKGQIWSNPGEVAGNKIDDDKNGFVDDVNGWNFYSDTNKLLISATEDGHGTHVAGTIAARISNGIGVAGVAERVQIMPLKFIGPQYGDTADAIRAIGYAKLEGAVIANNSWGGGGEDPLLYKAINEFGNPFIVAAGNEALDNDVAKSYPSSYDCDNIIAVAAVDNRGALATFSNYGFTTVDVAAPGVDIASCYPGSKYYYMSGTSMAAPHVSGIAALLLGNHPSLTPAQVKGYIMASASANQLDTLAGKVASGGLANAQQALILAKDEAPPKPPSSDDTTPPKMVSIDPKNKSIGVSLNKSVVVTFDEEIALSNGAITFVNGKTRTSVTFTASVSGSALTIVPTSSLNTLTKYTVTVKAGAVTDLAGNPTTASYSTTFTTVSK